MREDAQVIADEDELRFEVAPENEGERLDKYLAVMAPETSRSLVQKHIELGAVTVDGAAPKRGAATTLLAGSIIEYRPPEPEIAELVAEDIPLSILFQDPDIAVIDKPAGLVVHPALGHPRGTLVNALLFHVRDLGGIGGELRPGIVHRLDRDTTGVMVVAKNDVAHRALVEAFSSRDVEKEYLAITHGIPVPSQDLIDTLYGRHPTDRKKFSSKVASGKKAVTRYRIVTTYGTGAARLEVRIETGRTHQIRVHLADRGHPLVGDATYGTRRVSHPRDAKLRAITDAFPRPALHARKLVVPHPRSGEKMTFEAAIPADLVQLMEALS